MAWAARSCGWCQAGIERVGEWELATIYRILCRGAVIGTSELEHADAEMSVAFGRFVPRPAYTAVQAVFLLFTEALGVTNAQTDRERLERYYAARDELDLALEDANGARIPTIAIHIVDWHADNPDAEMEVEVFWARPS